MPKRAANGNEKTSTAKNPRVDEDDSGSDDDASVINVDFEWFDPQPAVDFPGLKTLLRQLFDVDNQLFDLSEIASMILAQPTLGSTVKCEGNESDPYAFLTVLNLHEHRSKAVVKQLAEYLLSKAARCQEGLEQLEAILAPDSQAQLGLILTERFINMPHQIVPPMYKMLLEEMQWALADKESYKFTHYLVLSKTYTEVASQLDAADERPPKKKKNSSDAAKAEVFYFHPEDEVLQKHAIAHGNFDYSKQGDEGASDSKRTFQELGVKPQGHMILIAASKFEGAVKALSDYLGSEA